MLNIQPLTDSCTRESRQKSEAGYYHAEFLHWPRVKDCTPTIHVLQRIRSRQWGTATPAQAMVVIAAALAGELKAQGNLESLSPNLPAEDRKLVAAHWRDKATTKEFNAAIRVLSMDSQTTKVHNAVAWLVGPERTQEEIQKAIRPIVEAHFGTSSDGSTLLLKNQYRWQGMTGYLASKEVFPHIPTPPKAKEFTLIDMFGVDE